MTSLRRGLTGILAFSLVTTSLLSGPSPAMAVSAFADTTVADFGAGTPGADTVVTAVGDGEVMLTPTVNEEFSGSTLPAGWSDTPWGAGGAATVSGGQLNVDGTLVATTGSFDPGRSIEYVATFGAATFQHVGFGVDVNDVARWAMFSTHNVTGQLFARTNNNGTFTVTPIAGSFIGSAHRYRIDWTASSVVFSIDGSVVHTETVAITDQMRPIASDFATGGAAISVDWLRMSPFAASGAFESRILDAAATVDWGTLDFTATTPAGTSLDLAVRTGDTPVPDTSWTVYQTVADGADIPATSRYLQYRATLATSDTLVSPALESVSIASTTPAPAAPISYPAAIRDGVWHLRDSNTSAPGSITSFAYGDPSDTPVFGDWDGDGTATAGLVRVTGGSLTWYLRNSNSAGDPDLIFSFGAATDRPLVGDWDGNGTDTPGLLRGNWWLLRNANSAGGVDVDFFWGIGAADEEPIVGDWDGNGTDTPGWVRAGNWWLLRNTNSDGPTDTDFFWGRTVEDAWAVGDWDGDGDDNPAILRGNWWLLRDANNDGPTTADFFFGLDTDTFRVWAR